MTKLTREQVMPIIERLGGIGDKGWTFSEMGLMALISEVEDLVVSGGVRASDFERWPEQNVRTELAIISRELKDLRERHERVCDQLSSVKQHLPSAIPPKPVPHPK